MHSLRRLISILAVTATLAGGAAPALAAGTLDLFAPAPATRVAPLAAGAERTAALAPGVLSSLADATRIRLALAPGLVVTADRSERTADGGDVVWSGDLSAGGFGSVDLVVAGGRLTGQVSAGGRTVRISPRGDGMVTLATLDPQPPAGDAVVRPPASALGTRVGPDRTQAITATTVRVLVAYTPGARASVSDIAAEARLAVSLANGAFRRSGVAVRLELAGLKAVNFAEAGSDFSQILKLATAGSGAFAGLPAARNALKADMVTVLTGLRTYCGMAWLGPARDYAVQVVSTACISYHSFAHEVGHTFGLSHDRYVEAPAPTSRAHFGFVNRTARIRDIMSYANACAAVGLSCTRVPMFSTPRLTWNGQRIGVASGQPGAADAAATLNANRGVVARFR